MVSIISEALPSDPKKADYTSLWAVCYSFILSCICRYPYNSCQGAHQALHVGGDERARRKSTHDPLSNRLLSELEEDTFKVMWELSDENNSAGRSLRRVKEHEFFENDLDIRTHWMPDVSGACDSNLEGSAHTTVHGNSK